MSENYEGAYDYETPDVADPEIDEGAEAQDVADPAEATEDATVETPDNEGGVPQDQRSRDSAFAEMRRAREAAERERDELQAQIAEYQREQRHSELIEAAQNMGLSDAEIQQVIADADEEEEREAEHARLTEENERLNSELMNIQIEKMMEEDLRNIQAIDPSIKSLDDLGEDFFKFRATLDGVDAYFAMKQKQESVGYKAAPPIGKANPSATPREYFTSEEIDRMSPEEIAADDALFEKVMKSIERL